VLQLGQLGDLRVSGLQLPHFVKTGRPHSGAIEGAEIGLRLFLATQEQESTQTEEQG
jgi:hypothetical protein